MRVTHGGLRQDSAERAVMTRIFPPISWIPAGQSFADTLVRGLIEKLGRDLAEALVLLPTRRACRAVREAFLRQCAGTALLLPRLQPLGDLEEDGLGLDDQLGEDVSLPPALPSQTRLLQLTRLILAQQTAMRAPGLPPPRADGALHLAQALAGLLDSVHINNCDLANLRNLVPDRYADHWQAVLAFLDIIAQAWPAHLAELGGLDPADRRNRLIARQTALWRQTPPTTPVIAAGSTGSIPATAALLAAIHALPQGAVVLPGLDPTMDAASWAAIDPTHPQDALKRLLGTLGIERGSIPLWPGARPAPPRFDLLMRALLPAAQTCHWRDAAPIPPQAWDGLRSIDCATEREEAGVIALLLRETLTDPDKTAALVTPDRALARQVVAELRRWGIEIDDSGGQPLALTPPGVFLRLTADAAAAGLAPVALLALLKHPLTGLGMAPWRCRVLVNHLDKYALRGVKPAPGLAGLRAVAADPAARATTLLDALDARIGAFAERLARSGPQPLPDLLDAHLAAAEALATTANEHGSAILWRGEDGAALAEWLAALPLAAAGLPPILAADYPALFEALLVGQVVRPQLPRHPRLAILGPREARLYQADRMILGGLNEGVWPNPPTADPWMSRPMRADFGLPPLDRQIGQSAQDFVQAASAPEVFLTRSLRSGGAPTVPSRWLLRLNAVLKSLETDPATLAAPNWAHWAGLLDRPTAPPCPASRPAPCPPSAARPRSLAVTDIELLRRDPYGLYAKKILRLARLDGLEEDPAAAERGVAIHQALENFVKAHPTDLPENAIERLLAEGETTFKCWFDRPGIAAFWWPAFARAAAWIIAREQERRGDLEVIYAETTGRLTLTLPGGDFELRAKADRLELCSDGTIALLDYKTGAVPSLADVQAGFAPQLPLEGVIAEAGGFAESAGRRISALVYWKLGGAGGGAVTSLAAPETLIAQADAGLRALIAHYDDPASTYPAVPNPASAPRYNDYAHLARIAAWLGGEDTE